MSAVEPQTPEPVQAPGQAPEQTPAPAPAPAPFTLLGDSGVGVCEGDVCVMPTMPPAASTDGRPVSERGDA